MSWKGPGPYSGIASRLRASDERVLQIRAVKTLASWRFVKAKSHPIAIAVALIGLVPILGAAAETVSGGDVGWFVWTTAIVYGLLVIFMLLAAIHSWTRVIALGPEIDSLLDGHDGDNVSRWLGRALDPRPQVAAFVFGAVASTWVGIQLSEPLGTYAGNSGLAYSLTIGWTGGIGALTVYWLWGAPAVLFPLARSDEPKLDWVAPLQTPAIQAASRLMVDSSRLAAIGLLLFSIPIALTVALASGDWSVWALSISSITFSLTSVLSCAVLPQVALENLVRRGKASTLREVRQHLPALPAILESATPETIALAELYESLAATQVAVIDWKRLLEYVLLLLSSVVPIVIALVSR